MKHFLIFSTLLVINNFIFAQAPHAFNYQAVVRDVSGQVIPGQLVSFRISIQQGSAFTDLYVETHQVTTNGFGMANLTIGTGTVISGDFSAINWSGDVTYIQTEVDVTGGSVYSLIGVSQLVSVPYSIYAESAGNVNNSDTSATNELNTTFNLQGTNIQLTDAGGTKSIDMAGFKVPQSAIVLSETHPNNTLINAGYTMIGKIKTEKSDTSATAFIWIDDVNQTNAPVFQNYNPIWTGTELIIWGGDYMGGYTSSGWKYNPSTDTWTQMTAINAPQPRSYYSAVWTGTEMIIAGGYNGSALSSAAKYNPATDTWTPLTAMPTALYNQSAVWTGTEMWTFGGEDGMTTVALGYKFNPATNSWSSIVQIGCPSARKLHSAVWTGSGMIIWGGYDGSSALSTGAYYTGGMWMSTNTGPSQRYNHSTVWTGSEMIIWAGTTGATGHMNDGMKYDPVANSWSAVTTTNAPSIRSGHATVWTGTDMMVWGGTNGTYLNTGGIYNYATDSWITISTTNAPAGRMKMASFFTNSKMFVWGGFNGSVINSGGIYGQSGFTPGQLTEMYLYKKN